MSSFPANTFLLGELVKIPQTSRSIILSFFYSSIEATIQAKVNDDLYVVSLRSQGTKTVRECAEKYGLPNRHLELEWGRWHGWDVEFIVPASELSR